jgi:hypothetical protein
MCSSEKCSADTYLVACLAFLLHDLKICLQDRSQAIHISAMLLEICSSTTGILGGTFVRDPEHKPSGSDGTPGQAVDGP